MVSKKNEPGQGKSGSGTGSSAGKADTDGPKKPYATIELKATEVKSGDKPGGKDATGTPSSKSGTSPSQSVPSSGTVNPRSATPTSGAAKAGEPAKPSSQTTTASATPAGGASASGIKSTTSPGTSATSGSSGSAKSASGSAGSPSGSGAGGSSGGGAKSGGGSGGSRTPPPEARASKGSSGGSTIGWLFSVLVAGLVGGFLALLGADTLMPRLAPQLEQMGIQSASLQNSELNAELRNRIAALETAQNQGSGEAETVAALQADLKAAREELARLSAVAGTVEDLKAQQSQLLETTQALNEQVASGGEAGGGGAISSDRLDKLEQQLTSIVAAAGQDPERQGIPELAALTGQVADLESAMQARLDALRDSVAQDIETRIAAIAKTSEQARSGTQRMDRQLATVSTDTARLGQRIEALKADGDRISETLRVVQEETGKISSSLDALKGDVESQMAKLAKPSDIEQAVQPVSEKVAALEKDVSDVVKAEGDRKINAQRIVLSLELANLKRAIDRGEGYSEQLGEVEKAASGVLDLETLGKYKDSGVATMAELQDGFRPISHRIMDAAATPEDGSVFDQLLAGAKSVVRVRRVNLDPDDKSAEAVIGRMEQALEDGRLGNVLEQAKALSQDARQVAAGWLDKVEARHAVDVALAKIEDQLKASLSGNASAAEAAQN